MPRSSKDSDHLKSTPERKWSGIIRMACGWGIAAALIASASACSWHQPYGVAVADESLMSRCEPLGTVTAIADMGALQIHPTYRYDAQNRALMQAEMMAATHVVWLGDYYFAAAAAAYRCLD